MRKNIPGYYSWVHMRQRCLNPNNEKYEFYGKRGISICDRWKDFNNFIEDMGDRPSKLHSVGRINNDGNYSPENCRWELPNQQAVNTSRSNPVPGVSFDGTRWRARLRINGTTVINLPFNYEYDAISARLTAECCH